MNAELKAKVEYNCKCCDPENNIPTVAQYGKVDGKFTAFVYRANSDSLPFGEVAHESGYDTCEYDYSMRAFACRKGAMMYIAEKFNIYGN